MPYNSTALLTHISTSSNVVERRRLSTAVLLPTDIVNIKIFYDNSCIGDAACTDTSFSRDTVEGKVSCCKGACAVVTSSFLWHFVTSASISARTTWRSVSLASIWNVWGNICDTLYYSLWSHDQKSLINMLLGNRLNIFNISYSDFIPLHCRSSHASSCTSWICARLACCDWQKRSVVSIMVLVIKPYV